MTNAVTLTPPTAPIRAAIPLASSKSESNRALVINALTGFSGDLQNLSTARDTQTMIRLLQSSDPVADVLDAGTTMRFLTAYFAATGQQKTLTGTPRMQERPIGILVDALRQLGASIDYVIHNGFPPLTINGFAASGQNQVVIRGDVSSQYISALLLIAPTLPDGLVLTLTGAVGSRPYIEMTIAQMQHFGALVKTDWQTNTIRVQPQPYVPTRYAVESDWSSASYWYSVVALAPPGSELELLGLKPKSLQGDSAIQHIMKLLGVVSTFTETGVLLTQGPVDASLAWDFADCPDLAQTVAVTCAVKAIPLTLTGIESLKIKETDRVVALQTELPKLGASLAEIEPNTRYEVRTIAPNQPVSTPIATYDDHRMAMAFAPVAMRQSIDIEEPGVVAKSYPSFWDDFRLVAGVTIS